MKPRLDKKEKIQIITGLSDNATMQQTMDYCKKNNVSTSSFYRWKKRFKKLLMPTPETDRAFLKHPPLEKRRNDINRLIQIRRLQEENKVLKDKLIELILKP